MGSTGESWAVLESRVAATRRRVQSLEWEPERRNSFTPYTVERGSAYADLEGRRYLMMSGYSYLGLGGDQRVIDAVAEAFLKAARACKILAG